MSLRRPMTPARNRPVNKPDNSDLSGFKTLTLSELLSSPQPHLAPPQAVVCRSGKDPRFSGGPEGIRTPDLLNAICRAVIRHGLRRSMSVFESVRYRLLLSTAVAAGPLPAAVKCAVSLSVAHVPHAHSLPKACRICTTTGIIWVSPQSLRRLGARPASAGLRVSRQYSPARRLVNRPSGVSKTWSK